MKSIFSLGLLIAVALSFAGCAWKWDYEDRDDLAGVYREEFHGPLPNSVTEIRGRDVRVGDTWSRWLAFTYDERTLPAALANAGLGQAGNEAPNRTETWRRDVFTRNVNTPEWWKIPASPEVILYYRATHPNDIAGYTYVWIDAASRTVYMKSAAWR